MTSDTESNDPNCTTPDLSGWVFSYADFLKGLRKYLDDTTAQICRVSELPPPSVILGYYGDSVNNYTITSFQVDLLVESTPQELGLMLYQATPEALQREYGFHTQLAQHMVLPVIIQDFVAGNPHVESPWMVLEGLDNLRPPEDWAHEDYREAMQNLANLHYQFWGLAEDLDVYDWLWQPLTRDYKQLREQLIRPALHRLIQDRPHQLLAQPRYEAALVALEKHLDQVIAPLKAEPFTLTHGSYWAGNIARPLDGRQIVGHWQYVAIAPAILDMVMFYQSTISHLTPKMSPIATLDRYRGQMALQKTPISWTNDVWDKLWDHGVMWLFALHWLKRLADMPVIRYEATHERLERVWYIPLCEALERRLGITLPN